MSAIDYVLPNGFNIVPFASSVILNNRWNWSVVVRTLNGLELDITANDNIVTSNNLKGNLGVDFLDLGTGTVSNSNLT